MSVTRNAAKPSTVWLMLIGLTVLSVGIAEQIGSTKIAIVAIFLISAIKADRVVVHYMEIKEAEANWQPLYRTWIVAVTAALMIAHIA